MKLKTIIILSVICLSAFAQQSGISPQLIKQISNSIFTVYTYGADGKQLATGSGFVIGARGLCVTNFHVLEDAFSAVVKMKSGEKIRIRNVVDFNVDADLVKFQLELPAHRTLFPLKIAPRLPMQGEDVINISTPLGVFEQTLSKGNVSSVRKIRDYGYLIQVTAPISQGSSGSPIMNTRGEVIGVATLMSKYGQNLNFAVTSLMLPRMNKARNLPLFDMSKNPLETRYVKQARAAIRQGNSRKAIDMTNIELRKNPKNHIAWVLLGDVYYLGGEYEKSKEYYKRAYDIFPTVENVSDYGLSVAALGKANGGDRESFQLAYNLFNEVVRLKPDPFIYYVIGDLLYDYTVTYKLLNPNKLQSALDALDYSLSLYQSDIAFIKRGEVKAAMNDIGSALVDYENAIKIDPQYYRAYYLRGKLRAFKLGNLEAALEDEEKALRLVGNDPSVRADILSVQALVYYQFAHKTGNGHFVSSSFDKLDEAYDLTGNEDYLELKQQIVNELDKLKQTKK